MNRNNIDENDIIDMLKQFKSMDEISGNSHDFTGRIEELYDNHQLSDDDLLMAAGGQHNQLPAAHEKLGESSSDIPQAPKIFT